MLPVVIPLSGTERLALNALEGSRLEARLEVKRESLWLTTPDVATVDLQTGHFEGSTALLPYVERLLDLMAGGASRLSPEEQRELHAAFAEIRAEREV